jgi:hypothetical protein
MINKNGIGPFFKIFILLFVILLAIVFVSGLFGKKTKSTDKLISKITRMGEVFDDKSKSKIDTNQPASGGDKTFITSPVATLQRATKVIDTNEQRSLRAQKMLATFRRLDARISQQQQQDFFANSRISLTIPSNFKSLHRNIEGKAEMLLSVDPDQMTSFKVISKNGTMNDEDKQFLQEEVLGIDLNEYEEIDAKKELRLNFSNVKVFRGTKPNFMSYGVLIYDKNTNKTVAVVYDGQPGFVLKNLQQMIDSVNALSIRP